MKRLILFVWLFCITASCTQSNLEEIEDTLPEGTGIDYSINRNKIDSIIAKVRIPRTDYVIVASHRGNWLMAPENTIKAYETAINVGAEIIEIDVRKTFDNHIVVIHDSSLDRTTNGTGKIEDCTLSYIKSLKTIDKDGKPTNYSVPTLEEVMSFAKGKVLIMIDKPNEYFPEVLQVLIDTKTIDHALFVENYNYAEAKEELSPYLFGNCQYVPRIKENNSNIEDYIYPFIVNNKAAAFEIRFSSDESHTLAYLDELKKDNKSIWVTTLSPDMCAGHDDALALTNPDAAWGWCINNAGANIILTDYVSELVDYLEKLDKRN